MLTWILAHVFPLHQYFLCFRLFLYIYLFNVNTKLFFIVIFCLVKP